jgi:hypothetical protein
MQRNATARTRPGGDLDHPPALVTRGNHAYVLTQFARARLMTPNAAVTPVSSHTPPLIWVAAGIAAVLVAGTIALWAYFGSAVFYEMIAAGIAACF